MAATLIGRVMPYASRRRILVPSNRIARISIPRETALRRDPVRPAPAPVQRSSSNEVESSLTTTTEAGNRPTLERCADDGVADNGVMALNSIQDAAGKAGRRLHANAIALIALLCLIPAGLYYAMLLGFGSAHFLAPVPHGLTFNSMLLHLLHGTFDVDPQAIGDEGSLRNGLIYTYFGVVLALLRLPLLWTTDFATTDFTRLSCLAAVSVMALFKVASALTVWRANPVRERTILLTFLTIAILIGGPQIQFLRASIYQEVMTWAAAFGAAFVYVVLRGYYSPQGFTAGRLATLAAIAGLCLLTRASTGLGLYLAFGLLCLALVWRGLATERGGRVKMLARLAAPALIAAAFVVVAGIVNYGRWGSPLLFTDPQTHLWAMLHAPDRLRRGQEYGAFNIVRLGYALAYYFVPVWVLRDSDGELLWSAFQHRTIDSVELPPSSFFASDPLILALAVFALVQLVRHRHVIDRMVAVPVLAGLAVPIALILTFISMTFRYRMEFYPFLDLCGFLGFGVLLSRTQRPPARSFVAAALFGVVASHALWVLYMLSPFGSADELMRGMDIASYYASWFR
jgi:hypothetical protein